MNKTIIAIIVCGILWSALATPEQILLAKAYSAKASAWIAIFSIGVLPIGGAIYLELQEDHPFTLKGLVKNFCELVKYMASN
jgi:hypothetical protein